MSEKKIDIDPSTDAIADEVEELGFLVREVVLDPGEEGRPGGKVSVTARLSAPAASTPRTS